MRLIERLTNYLMKWAFARDRIMYITGTGGPDDVYLVRYFIVKSRFFNFFIHQFMRSDKDDLHDHPWDFCTYLVNGSYTEKKFNPKTSQIDEIRRCNYVVNKTYGYRFKKNSLVFRRATDSHQVVVDKDLKMRDKGEAALTLCFTGPTRRTWGFWKEHERLTLPSGRAMVDREWVKWTKYLGLDDDAASRG